MGHYTMPDTLSMNYIVREGWTLILLRGLKNVDQAQKLVSEVKYLEPT